MIITKMRRVSQAGFTITELMIATTVFSAVLLVALAGFLEIGNLFYRGVSISQTQETADHIFQDINGNFQTAANIGGSQDLYAGGYDYYCVGDTRYTYRIGNEVNSSSSVSDPHSPTGTFGILKDSLPGSAACAAPCDDTSPAACPAGTVKLSSPVELLGDKMRVEGFSINQSTTTSNLYDVSIAIAYGDDSSLQYTGTPGNPGSGSYYTYYDSATCQGNLHNAFCAVSRIDTSVYRGWHQ